MAKDIRCRCWFCGENYTYNKRWNKGYSDTLCSIQCQQLYAIWKQYKVETKLEALELMERKQRAECECCGDKIETQDPAFDMIIDHCHVTGVVRGVVCRPCNAKIGAYETGRARVDLEHITKWSEKTQTLEQIQQYESPSEKTKRLSNERELQPMKTLQQIREELNEWEAIIPKTPVNPTFGRKR